MRVRRRRSAQACWKRWRPRPPCSNRPEGNRHPRPNWARRPPGSGWPRPFPARHRTSLPDRPLARNPCRPLPCPRLLPRCWHWPRRHHRRRHPPHNRHRTQPMVRWPMRSGAALPERQPPRLGAERPTGPATRPKAAGGLLRCWMPCPRRQRRAPHPLLMRERVRRRRTPRHPRSPPQQRARRSRPLPPWRSPARPRRRRVWPVSPLLRHRQPPGLPRSRNRLARCRRSGLSHAPRRRAPARCPPPLRPPSLRPPLRSCRRQRSRAPCPACWSRTRHRPSVRYRPMALSGAKTPPGMPRRAHRTSCPGSTSQQPDSRSQTSRPCRPRRACRRHRRLQPRRRPIRRQASLRRRRRPCSRHLAAQPSWPRCRPPPGPPTRLHRRRRPRSPRHLRRSLP